MTHARIGQTLDMHDALSDSQATVCGDRPLFITYDPMLERQLRLWRATAEGAELLWDGHWQGNAATAREEARALLRGMGIQRLLVNGAVLS